MTPVNRGGEQGKVVGALSCHGDVLINEHQHEESPDASIMRLPIVWRISICQCGGVLGGTLTQKG